MIAAAPVLGLMLAVIPMGDGLSAQDQARCDQMVDRAMEYFRRAQNEDGSFGEGDYAPAMTALAVNGMIRAGRVPTNEGTVAKGLVFLKDLVQPDGGIYMPGPNRNYPTAIAILAFAAANDRGAYDEIINNAVAYLKKEQWDEGEGIDATHVKYGGAGYGSKSRPDLSNTAYFLEALSAAGVPKDDPAYQRALVFVSRCQNLSGEGNDLPVAGLVDDGGFYYTPAEDYNPGGKEANGGLRSYASMTYAGLKSFIHAGLTADDPRVKAANEWIRNHYTLDENPGMGQMGLFYYYHTFAKALDLMDVTELRDSAGQAHDWRMDLLDTLEKRQREDGSWANEEKRWLESDPRLVTAYCLMALGHVARDDEDR